MTAHHHEDHSAHGDAVEAAKRPAVSPSAMKEAFDQIITSAMSWQPSEDGPSYMEKRADLEAMLNTALAAAGGDAEPAVFIEREALEILQKDKTAKASVASGLLKRPFGDKVPLYAAPPLQAPADSDAVRERVLNRAKAWYDTALEEKSVRSMAQAYFTLLNFVTAPAAKAPAVSEADVGLARWRHKKRGSTYTEVGRGRMQCEWLMDYDNTEGGGTRADLAPVVVYRADVDGSLWVRPEDEFMDGRFEPVVS
jgi:hypothetical protein